MRTAYIAMLLLILNMALCLAQEAETENVTKTIAKYLTPAELGIEEIALDKLVINKMGETVKAYSFSNIEEINKVIAGMKTETLKQRLTMFKDSIEKKELVSLPISQQVDIYEISTIYANVNKKVYRSRVRITLTSPDNYKTIKIIQMYPLDEDISTEDFMFKPEENPLIFKNRDPMLEWNIPLVSPGQLIKLEYYVKDVLTNANVKILALGEPYTIEEPEPEEAVEEPYLNESQNESANETSEKFNTERRFSTALLLSILSIITLVSIIIAIFHFELKEKAVAEKRKHGQNLDKYVKTSLEMGADPKTLREALIGAGWDSRLVDKLIEQNVRGKS